MAFVLGPTFFSASAKLILKVCASTSTQTGTAPKRATDPAVAKKVNAGNKTSSPGPIPRAMSGKSKASVPEDTPIACFTFKNSAQDFSKASRRGPMIKAFDFITSLKVDSYAGAKASFCGPRSNNGTVTMTNSSLSRTQRATSFDLNRLIKITVRPRINNGKVQNCPAVKPIINPSSGRRNASVMIRAHA